MDKAYDLKALGEALEAKAKSMGLPMIEAAAEKMAEAVYFAVKDWVVESAKLSPNKIDDLLVAFYAEIDGFVLPQLQKIDPASDNK